MHLIDEAGIEMSVEITDLKRGGVGCGRVVRVEFRCDHDASRPECWGKLPPLLESLGFVLERDFDGSPELFVPSSFFSARAFICASKAYPEGSELTLKHELTGLTARMMVNVETSLVASGWRYFRSRAGCGGFHRARGGGRDD